MLERNNEAEDLAKFLKTSKDLKQMRYIALTEQPSTEYTRDNENDPLKEVEVYHARTAVAQLEKCKSFTEIIDYTAKADFNNVPESVTQYLGPTVSRGLSFVGGLFGGFTSSSMNFNYYLSNFREATLQFMADKGYKLDGPRV
jgi:hypothetical protein